MYTMTEQAMLCMCAESTCVALGHGDSLTKSLITDSGQMP